MPIDFSRGMSGSLETETLQTPALESRQAHITSSTKAGSLKQGRCSVTIRHATGLRLTLTYDNRAFHLFGGPLEVEICEVHVAAGQYVYGENVFPFAEANFEKL